MQTVVQIAQIAGAIALPNIGGYVGSHFFPARTPWYAALKKSDLVPPGWVFPIVWPTLYSSIGLASYIVWKEGGGFGGKAKVPLILYGTQLILNWAWTPIFFGAHMLKTSLVDSTLILIVGAACAHRFFKVNTIAGCLMVPYVMWSAFATFLNLRSVQLNSDDSAIDSRS